MSCQFSNDDLPSTSVASDDDWVGAGTATMQNPVAEIQCQHCDLTVPKNLLDLHEVGCAKDIAHRRSLHSRISNKQSVRPKPVNNRVEKPVQRDMRQNVLKAAENRTTTNPQIRQSAYNVVTLGDGTQVLKKRNVDVQSGHTGHILGRAKQLPTGRNTSVGPSDLSLSRPVRR